MPRPHRIEFNGAWYLVKNNGHTGRNIFNEDEDRELFLELLGEVSQIFSVEIHAYCLLDDQYLLLVHTPKGQLSRAMRHLNGVYTQKFNQLRAAEGAVFHGRYQSWVLDPERYLIEALATIHAAPIEQGVVKNAEDFEWSSHRAYLKGRHRPAWLTTNKILRSLGFIRALAVGRLNRLVKSGPSVKFQDLLDRETTVLGDDRFKQKVREMARETHRGKGPAGATVAREILEFVARHYEVPVTDLKTSRPGIQNEARSMAVYQLRTVGGLPQRQIAKILDSPSGYTVAKTLQRFNEKMAQDKNLLENTQQLTQDIRTRVKRH